LACAAPDFKEWAIKESRLCPSQVRSLRRQRFSFGGPLHKSLHAASTEVRRVAIASCIA
jgi:hypothetical protein